MRMIATDRKTAICLQSMKRFILELRHRRIRCLIPPRLKVRGPTEDVWGTIEIPVLSSIRLAFSQR